MHGGVTALSPPVSAKGHAGRAKPFPNILKAGGFSVVKGRKVIPCMESAVHRFGTGIHSQMVLGTRDIKE